MSTQVSGVARRQRDVAHQIVASLRTLHDFSGAMDDRSGREHQHHDSPRQRQQRHRHADPRVLHGRCT